jgi:uridine kinase
LAGAVTDIAHVRERVLVGIDGPPAAGKTTLADQLASRLQLHAVRASVEAFLLPQQIRYQRGELSPDGCYRDSFDYPALMNGLIAPFRACASRVRLSRTTDRASVRDAASGAVPARAVLIFDGVFLLRDQLRHIWDLSVYLCVPPAETLRRALARDLDTFGTTEEIRRRHLARYLPAQAIYRSEADPEATAHTVIGNERPCTPTIKRWRLPGTKICPRPTE